MNADQIVDITGSIVTVASKAAELGHDVTPFAKMIYDDLVNKKQISQSDIVALRQKLSELEARALAPLPPAEPDEL